MRLEDHLRSPVAILRSRSAKSPRSLPPAQSKPGARASKRHNTGVTTKRVKPVPSHLLKSGISKIHPIKAMTTTGNHLTSCWRGMSTTKGKMRSIAPLRLKVVTSTKLVLITRWRTPNKHTTARMNIPITYTTTKGTKLIITPTPKRKL
jgi:hypothetical protein